MGRPKDGDSDTKLFITVLLVTSMISVILAIGIGSVNIPVDNVIKILLNKLNIFSTETIWTASEESIVLELRLPRVLLGMIVGASLSVTGVTMQALVRNHLADPFIIGVSSGATAFATLGILFGAFTFLGIYSLAMSAFLGAAVTITLVYAVSRVRGKINMTQLLLSGVAISMAMDAVTKIITLNAPNALGLHNASFWMAGSLAGSKWGYLSLPLIVIIICMFYLMVNYRALNLLLLGDETAGTLGINVIRFQKMLILISSMLAGTTIAVSGTIGFVGLMVPHITRMLVGSDHRKVLPISALLGGILVVWVDVAARTVVAPEELPIGVLTAIFGGPFFIWLLKRKTNEG